MNINVVNNFNPNAPKIDSRYCVDSVSLEVESAQEGPQHTHWVLLEARTVPAVGRKVTMKSLGILTFLHSPIKCLRSSRQTANFGALSLRLSPNV